MNFKTLFRVSPHLVKAYFYARQGRPFAISMDITDFCNLKCPYCYWLASTQSQQLALAKIVKLAQYYRDQGIVHSTLVGGEPTMRPDVLEAVTAIFPMNWVVTNGTDAKSMVKGYEKFDPTRDLPNTWVILSLDGVGEAHDKSRDHPGLYDLLKAKYYQTGRGILTTTTLHQGNRHEPAKLLAEWSKSGIAGMTFEFATPIGRRANPHLDLVGDDRNQVIDELLRLKRTYGGFLKNSSWGLDMQRTENLSAWVGAKNCPVSLLTISLDAMGRVKSPCVLGSNSANPKGQRPNCSACGCHVPTFVEGLKMLEWQTFQSVLWFI
jgi:MoaA/NifB/PqqE/SkfB family radical SAM enzyme